MAAMRQFIRADTIKCGIFAGAIGGGIEIVWIAVMAALTKISAINVARGVSASVGIGTLLPAHAIVIGIAIHMALATALGIAVAVGCHVVAGRAFRGTRVYLMVLPALIGVWAFNFLVLLPVINPSFVYLMPYPISLLSKLLFGLGAAEVLRRNARRDLDKY